MTQNTCGVQGAAATLPAPGDPVLPRIARDDRVQVVVCAIALLPAIARIVLDGSPAAWGFALFASLVLVVALRTLRQVSQARRQLLQARCHVSTLTAQLAHEQAALGAARQAADAASRSKSAFFAAASHELRTPLTGLLGVIDLLRSEVDGAGKAPYLVDLAAASGDALLTLVNDLLDLSKIEAGRFDITPADVDLHEVLRRGLEPLRARAHEQGLVLSFEWQTGLTSHWHLDARRVRQAVTNLVGNAVKFTETGSVGIVVGGHALGDDSGEWQLTVSVSDTGSGIEPQARAQLFDSFAHGDDNIVRRYGETGLGLHISRQMAQRMGGTIRVDTLSGQGSCFTMTLRARPAEASAPTAQPDAALEPHAVALRVLLADDNPTNRYIISEHLRRWGHTVHDVQDGREALDACGTRRFDLLLLDGRMPRINGLQMLERLRGAALDNIVPLDRDVFVAGVSANSGADDRAAFEQRGAQAFIGKPVEPWVLHHVVQRAIVHQQQRNIALKINPRAPRPLDRSALERLLELGGGAASHAAESRDADDADDALPAGDRAARLTGSFMRELPEHVDRLHEAREHADLMALREIAHALKGASVYVDMPVLTQLAGQTERLALDGPRHAALAAAAALQRCIDELAAGPQVPAINQQQAEPREHAP